MAGLAKEFVPDPRRDVTLNPEIKDYRRYGEAFIEDGARRQMDTAMQLPVTLDGALMPDAHQGYGLPIGGVLAVDNAVMAHQRDLVDVLGSFAPRIVRMDAGGGGKSRYGGE
ncbi:RtcB family protein [Hymenobacter psychrotolerans]|uniref:3'-phosphate/5'-hydroxy nucleic acid ligase n=1 Tax=Hymenobacter psychrotolerans DSM 18569 TaxID=1121959 RepID=A0A1M6XB48_9BACT|nr:RtcB family protein [Hymenobacter psychrotolerans]SHL03220.1 tRNA-splicing ligase RtcB [Hymenobacter psychrotolerans DSM 18569]